MNKIILTSIAIVISSICFGQTDTIYSVNNIISCTIKEISTDAVKYSYPNEELVNSIYKNLVQKIVLKSGRVEYFKEFNATKLISKVEDYETVTITQIENEIKGLIKIGEISSKAKGTTVFSNQEEVKERAYRKLKIFSAMMGANIVYLANFKSDGAKFGNSGSSTETQLSGIAFTNQIPNFDEFTNIIKSKTNFKAVQEYKMSRNASDLKIKNSDISFKIITIKNDNGLIILTGNLENEFEIDTFRVVHFDNEYFSIYYEIDNTSYNFKIKI